MIRLAFLLAGLVLFAHCTEGRPPVGADAARPAETGPSAAQASKKAGPAAPGTPAAQKAYVDPDSGELIPRPAQDAPAEDDSRQQTTLGASNEKMEVVPSPVPGGGVMIDLKGRFQNPVAATVHDNKATTVEHPAGGNTE